MPIILHSTAPLVAIDFYIVEEKGKAGSVQYHFIQNSKDMETWRSKGYVTEEELKSLQAQERSQKAEPGRVDQTVVKDRKYDPTKIVQILKTEWKRLSWRDQNVIFARSLKTFPENDGKTRTELDSITYRDMKLKTCLKRWNAIDERGEAVPVNAETIDALPPEIAHELLSTFERITEPTSEDLKN